jgi:hypothetical protein
MLFGFFGKYQTLDEFDTLGAVFTPDRYYFLEHWNYNAIHGAMIKFLFDINAVEATPDKKLLLSSTQVTNDGVVNGKHSNALPTRGYLYNSVTVRALVKNRVFNFNPDRILSIQLSGGACDRSDFINVSAFINAKTCYLGQVPGASGPGSADSIKGIKGRFTRLKDLYVVPFSIFNFIQFNTIEYKFPPTLERLEIRANGIASVLNDRITECVNLKEAIFVTSNTDFQVSPYTFYTFNTNCMVLTGTMSFAHCPLLEVIAIRLGTLTSIVFHASSVFKFFQINSTTTITASELRTAIDLALASSVLAKFYCNDDNLTWTRSLVNADIASSLVHFYFWGNIITGSITITTAKATLTEFKIGNNTVSLAAASKNDFATVSITGITAAVTIDLSNSKISNLTLPVNTTVQNLYLGGNKLDVSTNPSLISQIQAMTNLRILWTVTGSQGFVGIEDGQNSTNGLGANVDLSALTLLTTFFGNKSVLSGSLKLPTSIIDVSLAANNLSSIAAGTISSLRFLIVDNNASFVFDFTRVPVLQGVSAKNCAIVTVDFSSRTSTLLWVGTNSFLNGPMNFDGCTVLTAVTFPTTQARSVMTVFLASTITFRGCTVLATMTNIENINYDTLTATGTRQFFADACALNIDFKFGTNNWLPTEILIQNNSMSNANVNLNINNIYTNRRKWDTTVAAKSMNIAGTNAAPSGTFVAPTGYKTATVTGITKAATAVMTVSAIGTLANNNVIRVRSVLGMTEVNQQYFMIKNISGNTFELWNEAGSSAINSTAYTTYISGGSAYVEGSAPANEKEKLFILVNVFAWTMTYN